MSWKKVVQQISSRQQKVENLGSAEVQGMEADLFSTTPSPWDLVDPRWKMHLPPTSVQLPFTPLEDQHVRVPGTNVIIPRPDPDRTYVKDYDFTVPSRDYEFDTEPEEIKNSSPQLQISSTQVVPRNFTNGRLPDVPCSPNMQKQQPFPIWNPVPLPPNNYAAHATQAYPIPNYGYQPHDMNWTGFRVVLFNGQPPYFPNFYPQPQPPMPYPLPQFPMLQLLPPLMGNFMPPCPSMMNPGNFNGGSFVEEIPPFQPFGQYNSSKLGAPLPQMNFGTQTQAAGEFHFQQWKYTTQPKPTNAGCNFCWHNCQSESMVYSHQTKDKSGKVTCPVLRAVICPDCYATGDNAHTRRHCPKNSF